MAWGQSSASANQIVASVQRHYSQRLVLRWEVVEGAMILMVSMTRGDFCEEGGSIISSLL